jgi:hypothetical protein
LRARSTGTARPTLPPGGIDAALTARRSGATRLAPSVELPDEIAEPFFAALGVHFKGAPASLTGRSVRRSPASSPPAADLGPVAAAAQKVASRPEALAPFLSPAAFGVRPRDPEYPAIAARLDRVRVDAERRERGAALHDA